jgi:DNA-directed RNA polymerase specialized sigma24 family protein
MAEDSFGEFVQARLPSLSRATFLLCGEALTAKDLMQQTLINVASRSERGLDRVQVADILYCSTVNTVKSQTRPGRRCSWPHLSTEESS